MTQPQAEQEIAVGPEHLHFVGPPMNCCGFVELHNRSSQRLKLRQQLPILASGVRSAANLPLANLELSALVTAGGTVRTRLNLSLHPQTPPGRYEAEVIVGKEPRKTTIEILEAWDI